VKARNYIAGEWEDGAGDLIEVRDPSDGSVVGWIASASEAQVDQAVDAACAVLPSWGSAPVAERCAVLEGAALRLHSRSAELSQLLAAEGGRPIREARAEVAKAIATFEYYAGLAGALDGRAFAGSHPDQRHETRREPIGVVVAITPWNVPAAAPARKLAPAVLSGAPVLLKPASATPLTAAVIVEALADSGAPPGSVQLLAGSGGTVGRRLATGAATAAVTFTGSTEVGLALQRELAGGLTRTQLELGGKNAAIVLADADLDRAAELIVTAAFASAGQQCTATSRVVVERSVAEPLAEAIVLRAAALRMGPTLADATDLGPLIDADQVASTVGYIERAVTAGATIRYGGHAGDGPGCYHEPTVLTDVTPSMEIAREEVFGPVLSIIVVNDADEAVAVVNDTPYGLSSAVHTHDLGRAQELVGRIDCGVVVVNGPTAGIDITAPFGGFKASGTATKEHGPEAIDFFTRTKLVTWHW
jgi:alpha-ketoglutaric semialdehyde dehydrogenase